MKCGHCGAGEPNVYRSNLFHPDFGFVREWSCMKCGSRDIKREEKDMAKKGTCLKCGKKDVALSREAEIPTCWSCQRKAREAAHEEAERNKIPKDQRIVDSGTMADEDDLTPGAGNPPPSSPPPPSGVPVLQEGMSVERVPLPDFPVIVLSFPTERDRTLYHAILGRADSARNERVDQHILHLLEKALGLSM